MSVLDRFFGKNDDFVDVSNKIDGLIKNINSVKGSHNSDENIGNIIDSFISSADNNEISKLYQSIGAPTERITKYSLYEEMYKVVPIIRKIIKTYISNIIPKNPTDGRCIVYKTTVDSPSDRESFGDHAKNYIKNIVEYFDIVNKYKNIILPRRLLYGDCFVEVADVSSEFKNVDLNKSQETITEETVINLHNLKTISFELDKLNNSNIDKIIEKIINASVDIETVFEEDAIIDNNTKDPKDTKEEKRFKNNFNNIVLKIHKPHDIIVLYTKYGSILGYIELIKPATDEYVPYTHMLTTVISKLSSAATRNDIKQDQLINKIIYYILKKLTLEAKLKYPNINDVNELIKSLNPDIYLFIKRLFIDQGIYNKQYKNNLKIRFIPPSRMVQFRTVSLDSDQMYGESLIDGIILPCKLYMLSQLSNTVSKLSRAAVTRKWTLEEGSSRMHSQRIQQLRRELNNTKTTLNDYSTLKNVPKIFSDYKDWITISQNGIKPFDVEIINTGDANINVADLEDARKEIISLSGVPAPYLGYADTIELKEQLVHTNVAFATEIIDIQEQDISSLNKIIRIISDIQGKNDPTQYINISLIPPTVLTLQLIEMTISSIGNISSVFMNAGKEIDIGFFLKQYVPHIDWDAFDADNLRKQTKDKLKSEISGNSGGDMQQQNNMAGGM